MYVDSFFPSYGFRACSLFRSHSFPLSLSGPRFRFSNFVCVCIIFWVLFRCSVCRFGVVSSPVHILYLRNTLFQQRKQKSKQHIHIHTHRLRYGTFFFFSVANDARFLFWFSVSHWHIVTIILVLFPLPLRFVLYDLYVLCLCLFYPCPRPPVFPARPQKNCTAKNKENKKQKRDSCVFASLVDVLSIDWFSSFIIS